MTEAIFRENSNIPVRRRSRFADVEVVDLGAAVGFVSVTVGLGLVWLPLAFIIPGAFVFVLCLWRILRTPRSMR